MFAKILTSSASCLVVDNMRVVVWQKTKHIVSSLSVDNWMMDFCQRTKRIVSV